MMELVTWPRNPWSIFDELESLHDDVARAANESRRQAWQACSRTYPLMNVWTGDDGVVIDCELPGANPEDLDVSVQGDELTLKGKVNAVELDKKDTCHRGERPRGEFTRVLELPFRAEVDAVKANYKNGILRLSIPRSEQEKPRKIAIEA